MERRRGPRLGYTNVAALALVVSGGAAAYSLANRDVIDRVDPVDRVEQPLGEEQPTEPAGDQSVERVEGGNLDLAPHGNMTLSVDCPEGKVAVSGGTWTNFRDVTVTWTDVTDENTYAAAFLNTSGESRRVGVHVSCLEE